MNLEGLGKMFEGDSADTCGGKFTLVLIGGQAEGLVFADPGAKTPIGDSGNFLFLFSYLTVVTTVNETPEGVVGSPPPGPLGAIFVFFSFFCKY
jgi:hypothetical protein